MCHAEFNGLLARMATNVTDKVACCCNHSLSKLSNLMTKEATKELGPPLAEKDFTGDTQTVSEKQKY